MEIYINIILYLLLIIVCYQNYKINVSIYLIFLFIKIVKYVGKKRNIFMFELDNLLNSIVSISSTMILSHISINNNLILIYNLLFIGLFYTIYFVNSHPMDRINLITLIIFYPILILLEFNIAITLIILIFHN